MSCLWDWSSALSTGKDARLNVTAKMAVLLSAHPFGRNWCRRHSTIGKPPPKQSILVSLQDTISELAPVPGHGFTFVPGSWILLRFQRNLPLCPCASAVKISCFQRDSTGKDARLNMTAKMAVLLSRL